MALDQSELPDIFKPYGGVPSQWGWAAHMPPTNNYCEQEFGNAYDMDYLRSRLAALGPLAVRNLSITAYYSRIPPLSDEQQHALELLDVGPYAVAADLGALAYGRGHVLDNADTGKGPYGFPFTPNCLNFCIFPNEFLAHKSSSNSKHLLAIRRARDFHEAAGIVKLQPVLTRAAGSAALSLSFRTARIRPLFSRADQD
jgi:hypothetical protein